MPDRIAEATRAIETASKALTLAERIAARLGLGNPAKRATWLRMRAIRRRKRAASALTMRGATRLLAGAAADDAMADVLDPPKPATCAE